MISLDAQLPAKHARRNALLGVLAIVVSTFAAYWPAVHAGYVWDDDNYVTKNPLVTANDGFVRAWFTQDAPSQYFPLVYTTFRVEHAIWGLNPRGYHVVNIALHALNALLVWQLLRKLNVPGAWLAGAVFALHPVHVESVAWITERKNVLSGLLYFAACLFWVKFADATRESWDSDEATAADPLPRRANPALAYVPALLCYILSLFAKTTACTLPAALVLIFWIRRQPITWRRWAQILPFVVWGVAMGAVTMWWEHGKQGTLVALPSYPILDRFLVAGHAVWFYAMKLVWPTQLAFSYAKWDIHSSQPLQYIAPAACVALLVLLWTFRKSHRRVVSAIAFFLAAHLPTLGFITLLTFLYTYVADHYQYLPSVGLIALVVAGLMRLPRGVVLAVAPVLLLTLGVLTWRQSTAYASSETLWRDTLRKNPSSWMAHANLGADLVNRNDLLGAEQHLRQSLAMHPKNAEALLTLGRVYELRGDIQGAVEFYQRAIETRPSYPFPHYNLGALYDRAGDADKAVQAYRKVLEMLPRHEQAHNNLGVLLFKAGKPQEAMRHYQAVLEYNSANASAHRNMANALRSLGRTREADEHAEQARALEPENPVDLNNEGIRLAQQGDLAGAERALQRAIELRPDMHEAYLNLGIIYEKLGRAEDARRQYQRATAIKPADPRAQQRLRNLSSP